MSWGSGLSLPGEVKVVRDDLWGWVPKGMKLVKNDWDLGIGLTEEIAEAVATR